MPRVPNDFGMVQADSRALQPFSAGGNGALSLAGAQAQQTKNLGDSLLSAGSVAGRIAIDMQERIRQAKYTGGLNSVNQERLNLAFDKDNGYLTHKGINAVQRENGQTLDTEFAQKLQERINKIAEDLGDDGELRERFSLRANDILTAFRGEVQAYALGEFKKHELSVQDGALKLAADDAERNWRDSVRIEDSMQSVRGAVSEAGRLQGLSANEIMARMLAATSMVHKKVIDAALQNKNTTYAMHYKEQHKAEITAGDLLQIDGVLLHTNNVQQTQSTVAQTTNKYLNRFQPSDYDRLVGIVGGMESGGADRKADGTPMTSTKGALYRMQVMPDTAKNPGFGIAPAKNNSPEEYNRVGEELLQKLVTKYGNVAQALAAYNAGQGRVDAAIKQAAAAGEPQNWNSYLPQETQKYVRKGMAKFGAGMGAASLPTELEFVQDAVARLGTNPNPQLLQMTREAAEHQYGLITKSVAQKGDQALARAQQELAANNGDMTALSLSTRNELTRYAPGKLDDLMRFAKAIGRGSNETDLATYADLTAHPEKLARMSEADFLMQRGKLSEADFKHFANERAKLTGAAPGSNGPGDLNTQAIKQSLDERLRMLQIDPTPKDDGGSAAARIGGLRRFVDQYFTAAQREAGKKFTDAEVSQHLDALFAKNATFRGWFSNSSGPMLGMQAGDIDRDDKDGIKAALKRQGISNPTDAQILNAYWHLKVTRK